MVLPDLDAAFRLSNGLYLVSHVTVAVSPLNHFRH